MNLRAEGGQCAEIMERVDLEGIRENNDILKQGVQANGISSERGKGDCKRNVKMGNGSICAMSKCCLRNIGLCVVVRYSYSPNFLCCECDVWCSYSPSFLHSCVIKQHWYSTGEVLERTRYAGGSCTSCPGVPGDHPR